MDEDQPRDAYLLKSPGNIFCFLVAIGQTETLCGKGFRLWIVRLSISDSFSPRSSFEIYSNPFGHTSYSSCLQDNKQDTYRNAMLDNAAANRYEGPWQQKRFEYLVGKDHRQ